MVRHFFLDKTNTIYKNSFINAGLNPVLELNCGKSISRGLLHFNEKEILDLVEDKSFADLSKLSCHLKMTNCFSIDSKNNSFVFKDKETNARRASSFDLIAFELPQEFDEGRGFDNTSDFWSNDNKYRTNFGSSWYFSTTSNASVWPIDKPNIDFNDKNLNVDIENGLIYVLQGNARIKINLKGGIFSDELLLSEIEKYDSGLDSIIIGKQRFDYGYENLDIDITNYIKKIINGQPNYGIGLMFSLPFESWDVSRQQYVGFFTDHTNTFFHPYVECIYDNPIKDDRANFCLGKENNLYLYVSDNGENINLDTLPVCSINDVEYETEQVQKGIYCVKIKASRDDMESGTINYDKWSNLALNGEKIDDIELEFEIKPSSLKIGNGNIETKSVIPSIYGIGDDENINRGEVRTIHIDFLREFEANQKEIIDSAEYEIYGINNDRKITVVNFTAVEKAFLDNFFVIHTSDFVPEKYHIGIKINYGKEVKYFDDVLKFNIVSNVTNIHQ